MFVVEYTTTDAGESVMTITMTEKGLNEINTTKDVYSVADMFNSGYSDCTAKITYQAKMNSDASVIYGDDGNPNEVVLVWRRTSSSYYDTLVDDAHVFTYGIELTKLFSDGKGDFSDVQFIVANMTDEYYVKAELDAEEGIYYVVDHVTDAQEATRFVPVAAENSTGKMQIWCKTISNTINDTPRSPTKFDSFPHDIQRYPRFQTRSDKTNARAITPSAKFQLFTLKRYESPEISGFRGFSV